MELRHLRSFVVLAEELHFGRAASRLHIAQPALTQQLKSLEQELGVQLLFRTKREVRLTPAGHSFVRDALALIEQAKLAAIRAKQVDRGELESVTIAYTPLALFCVLPELLNGLRGAVPGMRPQLVQMTTSEQEEALRKGQITAGLLQTPLDDATIITERIMSFTNIAVLSTSHPFAGRASLRIADLADQPLVVFPRQAAPAMYDELQRMCSDAGFAPRFVAEASPAQSIISLAAANIGIGIIASPFRHFVRNGVVFKAIEGDVPRGNIAIAVRSDDQSAITASLLTVARQQDRFEFL